MPLYTYEHLETGAREERMVPLAQRDAVSGWRRIFEPSRFAVPGSVADPYDFETQVKRGLAKQASSDHRKLERDAQFTTSQLKQIWQ